MGKFTRDLNLQGDCFDWTPSNFLKYKIPLNRQHLEKFRVNLHRILNIEIKGGPVKKKHPVVRNQ